MPSERQVYSEEVREELRRRHEQGETITELAAKTGIPYPTVKLFLSSADRERSAANAAKG